MTSALLGSPCTIRHTSSPMSFLRHQALSQRSILFKQSLSSVCSLFPLQPGLTLTPTEGLWINSTQGTIWQGGCWQGIISSRPSTWINFPLSMRNFILLLQKGTPHSPFIYSGISRVIYTVEWPFAFLFLWARLFLSSLLPPPPRISACQLQHFVEEEAWFCSEENLDLSNGEKISYKVHNS